MGQRGDHSYMLSYSMQVVDLEKEIFEAKQKVQFYHAKMQELVSIVHFRWLDEIVGTET